MHDVPTDILQRPFLFQELGNLIDESKKQGTKFALLLIGINKFRQLNITHGFEVGDLILVKVYQRLLNIARTQDIVLRVGSSEFLMAIRSLHSEGHAELAAIKILGEFEEVFNIARRQLKISANIGGTVFPEHGREPSTLLNNTESALLESRRDIESYFIYSDQTNLEDSTKWDISSELKTALDKDQLELHFQPQVDLKTGQVLGAEALIRWNHPHRGYVPPDYFIPAAEQNNLIQEITHWTIHAALWLIRAWPHTNERLNVSVNLSAKSFEREGLIESISDSTAIFETDLDCLTLEVTESALMKNMDVTIRILDDLKELGVNISIDDFGTGYSSMSYFKSIPANELKIDSSFVTNMMQDPMDLHIVKSIISMAHGFGLKVVAEGIENRETFEFLKTLGCDIGQGFYISAALTQDDFIDWVKRYTAATS